MSKPADQAPDNVVMLKPTRCPMCGKPAEHAWRPFCSKRCADLDLGKWLDGDYRVESDEPPGEEEPA